jgi:hypothetical protein
MEILGLIVGFVAGACGSLILWVTLGKKLIISYAGKSVVSRLQNPDDDTEMAIKSVLGIAWKWFLDPSIVAGMEKDESGNEVPVKISPFQNLASEMGRYAVMRIRGMSGAERKKIEVLEQAIQSDLASTDWGAAIRSMLPKAFEIATKKGDYTPLFLQMISPMIEKLINTNKTNTQQPKNW